MYLVLLQNEENKMLNNLKDHKKKENKDHYFPRNPTNNELIIQGKEL